MRKKRFIASMLLVLTLVGVPIESRAVNLTDEDKKAMFSALRTSGLSDCAAAGIMGNVYGECGYDIGLTEAKAMNGIGLFQWSHGSGKDPAQAFFATEEHKNHPKITYKNTVGEDYDGTRDYTLCKDRGCQLAYGVVFCKGKITKDSKWASSYNAQVEALPVLKKAAEEGKIPKTIKTGYPFENWAKLDELEGATIQAYLDVYSARATKPFWVGGKGYDASDARTNEFIKEYPKRFGEAKAIYELCKGKYEAGETMGADSDMKESLAVAFKSQWSDEQLASYCKLTETNMDDVLKEAKRENLSAGHQHSLAAWEANIGYTDNWFLFCLRHLCIFVGICMIVWSMFIYTAYWFDRLNTFFDFSLVALLSIGRLHLSDTEQECTYFTRGKQSMRTVNNRAILTVCVLAIICGTFITTGTLYKLMLWTFLQAKLLLGSF